jgi:parvulin-like peptidyl-prolyl isomerase
VNKLLVSIVALVAVLSAACDSASGPALTVNGTDVSQSSVEREFKAIADNEVLAESGQPVAGEGDETLNPDLAAFWLTLRAQQEVIDEELSDRDLEVTAADREQAQASIEAEIGTDIFEAFPDWLQERLEGRYARRSAVLTALGGPAEGPTDEEVRAEFDAALAELKTQCASGKFVSHILVDTQPEADAIAAELAAGADFAEIARTRSQDPASAQSGGELFCYDPTQLDATFVATADTLALGQVSAPVQTQFGFHIIRMSDTIPFESVEETVRESLAPPTSTNPELDSLIADAKVRVDPRYGSWEVSEGQGRVQPPESAADSAPQSVPASEPAPAS